MFKFLISCHINYIITKESRKNREYFIISNKLLLNRESLH